MTTHGQVFLENEGVYLYKHHDAYDLPNIIRKALSYNKCWDAEYYLGRIIFDEISKNCERFYGCEIGTKNDEDIEFFIIIKELNIKVKSRRGYTKWKTVFEGSFDDFIKTTRTDWWGDDE